MAPHEGEADRSWGEYRRLILSELQRMNEAVNEANDKIQKMREEDIGKIRTDIALLQLKAGMWGALVGAVTSAIITMGAILLRFVK